MEAGGSLRRQSSLVADSLRGAPSHLVDPATGPNRGGQNWGNSVIESGEIPLILVTRESCGKEDVEDFPFSDCQRPLADHDSIVAQVGAAARRRLRSESAPRGQPASLRSTLGFVRSRIIDGERWIAERLAFLREQLMGELSDAERKAIETEVELLSRERGLTVGGRRVPRIPRRLRRKK